MKNKIKYLFTVVRTIKAAVNLPQLANALISKALRAAPLRQVFWATSKHTK